MAVACLDTGYATHDQIIKKSMSKRIYIAIEIMSRELYGKALLACVAAENGYTAVIGDSAEMREALRTWKPGTIVWKGLVKKGQNNYRLFHHFGHKVVAQCEEGLVYPSADFYTKLRVSEEALQEVDRFFAWGDNQANDILKKLPQQKEKIVLAGNPRIDLLDTRFRGVFDKEVAEIRARYSPYILVNTNFSAYTHVIGAEGVIQRLKNKGTIKNDSEEAFYRGRAENRKVLFHDYVSMLEALSSRFQDLNIVLRPHPSENLSFWQHAVSHLPGVHVVREGSAMPWIIASELMIHNDCTTAIEATLLGKNVISYRPTANNPYESELAASLGDSAENVEHLLHKISLMLNCSPDQRSAIISAGLENLKKYISSIDNDTASDVIVRSIAFLSNAGLDKKQAGIRKKIKMFLRRQRYKAIYLLKRYRNREKEKKDIRTVLSASSLRDIIQALNKNSQRFNNLTVRAVRGTESCFEIRKS